ncbi:hypothetical protein B0T21DRAFT_407912 [Apiosordaria backusii]|uniref:Phosphoglycerate mutase n=1 Tax=Apiosordaria backusii TaxID=314023 RepID=A0AA40ESS7_9PEZI|nr:hypothetical protein B0T21DRAFT_407912 [Apiosordaria backusii]
MGRPPAYLFVVRHGYRLDAADKQWHLSSPAPYDPPLTYSGWQQCKNLGVRIASILRERVKEDELEARKKPDPNRKRKRYKVVLHSSPFLRCIQTSIAISAGLAQDSTPFGPTDSDSRPPTPPPALEGRPRPPSIITETGEKPVKIRKSVLRLDAFLGEWLSPTYFELITPPPESIMMLASAKSELLRREDYTQYPNLGGHHHSNSQGHLWSPTGRPSPASPPSDGGHDSFGNMASLSNALPRSPNIDSQGSATSSLSTRPSTAKPDVSGYVSPVPHYAVSNNTTIPPGYVAHARDSCVKVDYQWDSRVPLLEWGDGGSFPEEWANMHKRFRSGVQKLVNWYTTEEYPTDMITKFAFPAGRRGSHATEEDDDEVETEAVVIMVSHGAGCNALIGAITHQPVLMDVGMASLTMAVRKPETEINDLYSSNSADLPPVHQLYDLKLFANSDHIRSAPTTPNPTRSPSAGTVTNGPRGRHMSFSSTLSNFSWNDNNNSRGSSANMALNGLRRTTSSTYGSTPSIGSKLSYGISSGGGITVGSGVTSFSANKGSTFGHRPSLGLWSPISSQPEEDEDDDFLLPNFGAADPKPASSSVTPKPLEGSATPTPVPASSSSSTNTAQDSFNLSINPRGTSSVDRIPTPSFPPVTTPKPESSEQLGDGPGGLWGGSGPRPPEDADRLRDTSFSKRRWTVTERS